MQYRPTFKGKDKVFCLQKKNYSAIRAKQQTNFELKQTQFQAKITSFEFLFQQWSIDSKQF